MDKLLNKEVFMKRISILFFLCICGFSILCAQSLTGKTVYAFTREVELKSSTWFFAGTTGTFEYGDEFVVLEEKGSWVQLRSTKSNIIGWASVSSVTTRQIVNSDRRTSASADELALAGKAYSEEVEKAYQDASQVDYSAVDLMESINISNEEVLQFMKDGRLNTGEQQ
jgi:hypothetical protein